MMAQPCYRRYKLVRHTCNSFKEWVDVDVLYAALQAHGIVNLALHLEYPPGLIFIFSQGRKDLYHV
jgi:hypothetical protein